MTVWVATTSVWVTSQRTASSSIRTGMCSTGTVEAGPGPLDQVLAGEPEAGLRRALEIRTSAGVEGADGVVEGERRDRGRGSWPSPRCRTRRRTCWVTSTRLSAASRISSTSTICPATGWFCGAASATCAGAGLDPLADRGRAACGRPRPRSGTRGRCRRRRCEVRAHVLAHVPPPPPVRRAAPATAGSGLPTSAALVAAA